MEYIKQYFEKLRFDPAHHLGLGDIRLTIGQQEEVIRLHKIEVSLALIEELKKLTDT